MSGKGERKAVTRQLTSFVQLPELEGWKKPSVDAINLTRESKALDPARKVLAFRWPPLPKGAER